MLQPGDAKAILLRDVFNVPMSELKGKHVVIEEKMDGANCGVSLWP
ncbi:MAG: RNA ligase family protein [Gemmataceae bacterium]